jgi:hypothetical protein
MKHWIAIVLLGLVAGFATSQSITGNLVTNPNFSSMTGWTTTGSGSNTSHPVVGANQYSFGTQGSVAQSIVINNALSGSGINVTGIQYGWRFAIYCNNPVGGNTSTCQNGTGAVDTLTANVNVTNTGGSTVFDRTHVYNTSKWSWISEAQDVNFTSTPLASMGNINIRFTGTDGGASTGEPYMGPTLSTIYARLKYGVETVDPCIANPLSSTSCAGYRQAYTTQQCSANSLYSTACPGYAAAYKTQQCSANPLYATDCPGYAAAYHDQQCSINALYASDCAGYAAAYKTQQCSINALYATDCPGYAAAYKTQQCTASPLYATDCPAYAEAYLNQQCLLDSLFSNKCTGYKTAYAIKYLVNLDPAVTTAVNSALTTTVEVQRNDPANAVSATGNSTVDLVVAAPSATSATSVTSPISVINTAPSASTMNAASAPPLPPPPGAAAEQKADAKKTEGAVASVEKKAGGNAAAAKSAAAEKAKELAKDVSRAATMEAQTATQGLLVGLIGYVPGFSAYQNSLVPDALGATVAKQYYKATVDNRSAQRQLSGANETRWKQIVDSQYNKE